MSPLFLLAVLAALVFAADSAQCKVPDPRFSSVDPVILDDPSGSRAFRVVVRDVNNAPLYYQEVRIDFSATFVRLNAIQDPGVTVDCANRTLTMLTGTNGVALFHPRFTGFGDEGDALVSADGVWLAHRGARSTDLDGFGGGTGIGDFAIFAPLFIEGSRTHPEADFDVSGGPIGLMDFALFTQAFLSGATGSYCP
jgi:hypothetical protein